MRTSLTLSAALLAAVILTPQTVRCERKGLFGSKPLVSEAATTATATNAPSVEAGRKVIAYYFHGTARCASCVKIETWSADAVKTGFARQLGDGTMEWRVVDTDEPANAHFMKDYQLYTKSVVLVEMKDGKQVRYRNLAKVWELLGDQRKFESYIKTETAAFLDGQVMEPLTLAALGSAFWFGIVTSVSPCPLATNIAAMSFLGKRVDRPALALLAGLAYTLGRVLAYVAVGAFIVKGVLSIPGAANWLQKVMNIALGPVLIVVGIFLLGVIPVRFTGFGTGERLQKWAAGAGIAAPLLLGAVFALSFCPVSAGLFFGTLVPLSLRHDSVLLLPTAYGIGTGLPVVVFAAVLAFGAGSLGRAYDRATVFALWAKRITGVVFIVVGIFHILRWNLHLV